jgi:hypothetical protein
MRRHHDLQSAVLYLGVELALKCVGQALKWIYNHEIIGKVLKSIIFKNINESCQHLSSKIKSIKEFNLKKG